MKEKCLRQSVANPYVSVEIKCDRLNRFRSNLIRRLKGAGFQCESTTGPTHVSLAYGLGNADFFDLHQMANQIANASFKIRTMAFEFLEGAETGFDYLVLSIESNPSLEKATQVASSCVANRLFGRQLKHHVSLVRFKKGSLSPVDREKLVCLLNARAQSSVASEVRFQIDSDCVCVYSSERERCIQIRFDDRRDSSLPSGIRSGDKVGHGVQSKRPFLS